MNVITVFIINLSLTSAARLGLTQLYYDCLEVYPIKQVIRYNVTLCDTLLASVCQSFTSGHNSTPPSSLSHNTGEQRLNSEGAKRAFSDGEDDFGDQCNSSTDTPDTLSDVVSFYFRSSFDCSGCPPVCWNEVLLYSQCNYCTKNGVSEYVINSWGASIYVHLCGNQRCETSCRLLSIPNESEWCEQYSSKRSIVFWT